MTTKQLPISIPLSIARPQSVVGADALLSAVNAGSKGLSDRIAGMDLPMVPGSFIGPTPAYTFQPEKTAFNLDVFQNNGAQYACNYIVRSGTTYQLPIIIGGNGVFLAHSFRINIWQRFYVNGTYAQYTANGVVAPMVNGFYASNAQYWTTKFSCYPLAPTASGGTKSFQTPSINYRWNIQDPTTGYNYCDTLMPASALLDRRFVDIPQNEAGATTSAMLFDGDWHKFDAPWRFDKATQLNVLWRPLTDIVQFDSSVNIGPTGLNLIPYDDRVGGLRNQAVSIQVEFQGERVGGR